MYYIGEHFQRRIGEKDQVEKVKLLAFEYMLQCAWPSAGFQSDLLSIGIVRFLFGRVVLALRTH
jgi:hypothetical protein